MIYTIGYPRSGNTWLMRLLSTALSEPVTRTHVAHTPFHETVAIARDVRDVIVSWQLYRGEPDLAMAITLVAGTFDPARDLYGPYASHQLHQLHYYRIRTTYEQLMLTPRGELTRLVQALGRDPSLYMDRIIGAVELHTFAAAHRDNPHAAPWGQVGRWRQTWTEEHTALAVSLGLAPFFLQETAHGES